MDPFKELVTDLKRKAKECKQMGRDRRQNITSFSPSVGRLLGKASAYEHAAQLLEEVLKDRADSV